MWLKNEIVLTEQPGDFIWRALLIFLWVVYEYSMESTELYEQILGIELPWYVKSVVVKGAATAVDVYLEHETGPDLFSCPECHQRVAVYDHLKTRVWRHLDACQYQTYLHASLPRVNCKQCGILTVAVSWARAHSRFSLLFEAYALDVLSVTQVQSRAAALLQLSPDQVRKLLADGVRRGLERRDPKRIIRHVTLDEKSLFSGQHYVSVLCDGQQGAVLEVVEHRTQAAAENLLKQGLSEKQRSAVEVVSLDLWA
ncbi:MAG: transposase family protein, partial [Acidobacteriota bacterium]